MASDSDPLPPLSSSVTNIETMRPCGQVPVRSPSSRSRARAPTMAAQLPLSSQAPLPYSVPPSSRGGMWGATVSMWAFSATDRPAATSPGGA